MSMWGESGPRPEVNHDLDELFGSMSVIESISVDCTPKDAWALISRIDRIGEFSPECVEAWWVDGFPSRCVGGRFEGRNRVVQGDDTFEWIRPCQVTEWDPPSVFSYTVGDRFDGSPSTRWRFSVRDERPTILLRQEFAHLPDGLSGARVMAEADPSGAPALIADRLAQLRAGMSQTLATMKSVLEIGRVHA